LFATSRAFGRFKINARTTSTIETFTRTILGRQTGCGTVSTRQTFTRTISGIQTTCRTISILEAFT
jgi:hypothetical protein